MKKVNFAVVFWTLKSLVNGDWMNENKPRVDSNGHGEVSDICLKRKIRNRLQDLGGNILLISDDRANGGGCTYDRVLKVFKNGKGLNVDSACKEWIDVRTFGQIFPIEDASFNVHGSISIGHATSLSPINISAMPISKSNKEGFDGAKEGKQKASDTLGVKYYVDHGVYVALGSINPTMANKNGLTEKDVALVKKSLSSLFLNDESSSRPIGTMGILKLIWWEQEENFKVSDNKVFSSLKISIPKEPIIGFNGYSISVEPIEGVSVEMIDETV